MVRQRLAMITYKKFLTESQVINGLIGMSLTDFEQLYAEFEPAHTARQVNLQFTRRAKLRRKRMAGAGRKHKYALHDRLLMTLFWLRAYTTYEVLGSFYHLDKTTVEDNIKGVLDTLTTMTTFRVELPQADVPKLRSMQEVMGAFPGLLLLLDAKE
jgi:Helix-turn-helix of DDE superfamily endonuclease